MENKREADGRAKLKAAMIDAAMLPVEKTITDDHNEIEIDIDPSGTPLAPGHPKICLGSGTFPTHECCCDNCQHFLKCFPDTLKPKNAT